MDFRRLARAPWSDPLVPRLKSRFGIEHALAIIGLVDSSIPGVGIKHALLSDPTSACSRHIRSLPFGRAGFFEG
jgi:hypothetical protein